MGEGKGREGKGREGWEGRMKCQWREETRYRFDIGELQAGGCAERNNTDKTASRTLSCPSVPLSTDTPSHNRMKGEWSAVLSTIRPRRQSTQQKEREENGKRY